MSRRETAIELMQSNRCMINSCLAKAELKQFNGDFAEYIIRQLSILRNQDKKVKESKKPESVVLPCKTGDTLYVPYSRPKYLKQCKVLSFQFDGTDLHIITDFVIFSQRDIGVTAFLDEESAENSYKGGK